MKKVLLLPMFFIAIGAFAQKKFDSSAYVNFYENCWEKISFSTLANIPFTETLSTEEKLAGLAKAWAEARYNFANFDLVPALNWDSLYTSFIPKVTAAKTTVDVYRVLQNFYQCLHDGHTSINLPFAYRKMLDGRLPLQVRWIENKVVVVANNATRSDAKGIGVGDELTAINGEALQDFIRKNISPYLHFSTPQDSVERIYRYELFGAKAGEEWTLQFKTAAGKKVEQRFRFEKADFTKQALPLLQFSVLPGNIAYVQLNSFGDEKIVKQFDSVFPSIAKTSALILDVRSNGGGNGSNGFEVLGYLTGKPFGTGKSMIRQYRPVGRSWGGMEKDAIEEEDWKPYKSKLYDKPVVVLTSAATYSAAEDFTATFKNMKRGKVIGEPTGGSTGQPVFFLLPGGGLGAVCAKRDFFSDGTEFVGVGIQPDVLVRPTVKGIVGGKDDVLEAAKKYLQGLK